MKIAFFVEKFPTLSETFVLGSVAKKWKQLCSMMEVSKSNHGFHLVMNPTELFKWRHFQKDCIGIYIKTSDRHFCHKFLRHFYIRTISVERKIFLESESMGVSDDTLIF